MQVAIVGTGAIGSLLGHGLQRGGHRVTLIDLPHRIDQIQAMKGLVVVDEAGSVSSVEPFMATTDYSAAGAQDVVILATKAHDLPGAAPNLPRLMHTETIVLTVQNGIPWWYLSGLSGELAGAHIHCLDPDRTLERCVPRSRIVGCVAYPAASLDPDGRVRHVEGRRFPVGELDGTIRDRTRAAAEMLEDAGFKSRVIQDIRSEIWLKALGALSLNPISALTRATMVEICSFVPTRDLAAAMMREAQSVAAALGATLRRSIEERLDGAKAVGPHKTSMLQDVEAGRPLEVDALLKAILELADMTRIEAPTIRSIHACTALLNNVIQSRGMRAGDPV